MLNSRGTAERLLVYQRHYLEHLVPQRGFSCTNPFRHSQIDTLRAEKSNGKFW